MSSHVVQSSQKWTLELVCLLFQTITKMKLFEGKFLQSIISNQLGYSLGRTLEDVSSNKSFWNNIISLYTNRFIPVGFCPSLSSIGDGHTLFVFSFSFFAYEQTYCLSRALPVHATSYDLGKFQGQLRMWTYKGKLHTCQPIQITSIK